MESIENSMLMVKLPGTHLYLYVSNNNVLFKKCIFFLYCEKYTFSNQNNMFKFHIFNYKDELSLKIVNKVENVVTFLCHEEMQ